MNFYDHFAEIYDELAWRKQRKEEERKFLRKFLSRHKEVDRVLDCACGTGHHAIILDEMGYEVAGSDSSEGMIMEARKNAAERNIEFYNIDFRDLSNTFGEKFDLVICPGNSYAHLLSEADLKKAFKEISKVLREGGILLINQRTLIY